MGTAAMKWVSFVILIVMALCGIVTAQVGPIPGYAPSLLITPSSSSCPPIIALTSTGPNNTVIPNCWDSTNGTIELIGSTPGSGGNGRAGSTGGTYVKFQGVAIAGATITYNIDAGSAGASANPSAAGDTWICNSTSNCASSGGTAVIVGVHPAAPLLNGTPGSAGTGICPTSCLTTNLGGLGGACSTQGCGGGGAGGPDGAGNAAASSSGSTGGTSDAGLGGCSGGTTGNNGGAGNTWTVNSINYGPGCGGGGGNPNNGGFGGLYGGAPGSGGSPSGVGVAGSQGLIILKPLG